ncbi:MAG: hypothetical protein H0V43_05230 [Gemmatimonadales bacterium]|nr:hypothetical protein [Gemmatimonadales bacterium]
MLGNKQIVRAESLEQPHGLAVNFWLTGDGKDRLERLKARHIGEHVAVLINSVVVASPALIVGQPESIGDTLPLTSESPLTVLIPLPPDEAEQLAEAVSQTWPAPADAVGEHRGLRRMPRLLEGFADAGWTGAAQLTSSGYSTGRHAAAFDHATCLWPGATAMEWSAGRRNRLRFSECQPEL